MVLSELTSPSKRRRKTWRRWLPPIGRAQSLARERHSGTFWFAVLAKPQQEQLERDYADVALRPRRVIPESEMGSSHSPGVQHPLGDKAGLLLGALIDSRGEHPSVELQFRVALQSTTVPEPILNDVLKHVQSCEPCQLAFDRFRSDSARYLAELE